VVICGDFNKQLQGISKALEELGFTPALRFPTTTHKQGGHLDQIFAKNIDIVESTISENFLDDISDHKCLKVTLRLQERTSPT
jgi:endonuclease/exonuclease/phosphatase (EEP) superfamily protein YafD